MPAPTVTVPTTGTDPKVATKAGLEGAIDAALEELYDDTQTRAPIANPTFTGTVTGVSKAMVGLGNVDNTADADKPLSGPQEAELNTRLAFVQYFDDDYSELITATVTENGKLVSGLKQDGVMVSIQPSAPSDALEYFDDDYSEVASGYVTENGKLPFGVLKSGTLVGAVSGSGSAGGAAATIRRPRVFETFTAGVNQFVMNGQSLSIRGGMYLSAADVSDRVFSGGVILRQAETANTFVDMDDATPESAILWNAVQQMKFLIETDEEYSDDYTILPSSHGSNGASIEILSKEGSTGSYEDLIHGVEEGRRLALAQSDAHAVQALSWMQGESNRTDTTAEYLASFNAMLADYRADIAAITGQQQDFVTFVYQPSSQQFGGDVGTTVASTISQAFFEASEADPRIIIAAPMYQATHADGLHFDGEGGLLIGMQWGKAMYKRVYRGENWRPLEPRRITAASPRIITVAFNVPEMPLVFDTENVTDPGDYGFVVEDDGGTLTIADISIVRDTVQIAVTRDLTTNPKVSYAYYGVGGEAAGPTTGTRGCLRDSDPTVGANGNTKLWNWGVMFQKPIPYVKGA